MAADEDLEYQVSCSSKLPGLNKKIYIFNHDDVELKWGKDEHGNDVINGIIQLKPGKSLMNKPKRKFKVRWRVTI